MLYCTFYFTCDRSLNVILVVLHELPLTLPKIRPLGLAMPRYLTVGDILKHYTGYSFYAQYTPPTQLSSCVASAV